MSWLRVFQSANPAHSGHSGGQEREPRVVSSEKYAARRGSVEDEMRMITARFAHALQRYTSRTYMHCLLIFQEVMPISKTRNQLYGKTFSRPSCCGGFAPEYPARCRFDRRLATSKGVHHGSSETPHQGAT